MINTNYKLNQPNFKGSLKTQGDFDREAMKEVKKIVRKLPRNYHFIARLEENKTIIPAERWQKEMFQRAITIASKIKGKLDLEKIVATFPIEIQDFKNNTPEEMLKRYFTPILESQKKHNIFNFLKKPAKKPH